MEVLEENLSQCHFVYYILRNENIIPIGKIKSNNHIKVLQADARFWVLTLVNIELLPSEM
jgi:hypothetical protein